MTLLRRQTGSLQTFTTSDYASQKHIATLPTKPSIENSSKPAPRIQTSLRLYQAAPPRFQSKEKQPKEEAPPSNKFVSTVSVQRAQARASIVMRQAQY